MTKVGVGVIVRIGSSVLMGLRKGAHGEGTWCFPGGHLEDGETVEEAASRELLEETEIYISPKQFRKLTYTDDDFGGETGRYITLFVTTEIVEIKPQRGTALTAPIEAKVKEPHKCERWEWFTPEQIPDELFLPVRNLLRSRLL